MEIKRIGDLEIVPAFGLHFVKVKADDGALILLNMDNIQYIDVKNNYVELDNKKFIGLKAKSMKKLCDLLGMGATDLC